MDLLIWLRAALALAATLALLALGAWAVRRFAPLSGLAVGPKRLRVVERLGLDPRRQLIIVQVDDIEHTLLLSPFGDRRIASAPAKSPPEPGAAA